MKTTILTHLKTLEENQKQILALLKCGPSAREIVGDNVEDSLPATSLEELKDLCARVADENFKKKLVKILEFLSIFFPKNRFTNFLYNVFFQI